MLNQSPVAGPPSLCEIFFFDYIIEIYKKDISKNTVEDINLPAPTRVPLHVLGMDIPFTLTKKMSIPKKIHFDKT